MNMLKLSFFFFLAYIFPFFASEKLQLRFECDDFVYNSNIHQSTPVWGEIFVPSEDQPEIPVYFSGKVENKNEVLTFRLVSRENYWAKGTGINIDEIDRTQLHALMYNEWKLFLADTYGGPRKTPNCVKEFLRIQYGKTNPTIHLMIYMSGHRFKPISFVLDTDKIPESTGPISAETPFIKPTPTQAIPTKELSSSDREKNNSYPRWIWAFSAVIPIALCLIIYFKK